ncbi:sil1, putative [Ixodes scapularis]|uniref:Nucleotide exchange factor SIL1 n=1 Tax=Ixodes scapularis TaxID=6945 RepID=B7PF93_IXOSC|nr:sil1, putative [Ixodes scapularis]|eukprot:XP_002433865.1 sil1, putative [Ixodes scapularis]
MRLLCLAAALLVLLERGQTQQHDLTVAANEGASAEQEREQAEDEEDEPARHFKATREWQEVQPGEVLPRGVHVRLNLETGRREAKRLDDEEPGESQKRTDVSKEGRLLLEEAKDDSSKSLPEKPRAAWRAEEFKKKMSSLKLKAKSDSEIVRGLLDHYRNATAAGKEPLLRDLEYLVHQYDTAVDFIRMDGLLVIVPDLNSTSETLRELVAFTLGSALQGLQEGIQLYGFCSLVPELLQSPDVDAQEKVVQAMLSLAEICHKEFQVHLPRLHSLLNAYQREVHSESQLKTLEQTSDYFEGLLHSLSQLLDSLERKQKDEL